MTSAIGGADPTRTTTDAEFALNDVVSDGKGSVFVYIQASEALTDTSAVIITEAGASEMVDTTSTASAFGDRVGIVSAAFLINEFGWAQTYGPVSAVNVATSAAANVAINSTGTAGRLDDDASSGAEIITGIALTAAESSNAAPAILNYPVVGGTIA